MIAVEMPTVLGRLENRLLANTREIVEEWAELIPQITAWEDAHLLDNPSPEALKEHKQVIDKCIMLGWLFEKATEQPDFPDRRLAETVEAVMEVYRDKKAMWHEGRLSKDCAERIISACFPE